MQLGIAYRTVYKAVTTIRLAIVAHARDKAIPFYRKLGYETNGEAFLELGVVHYAIRKGLSPA